MAQANNEILHEAKEKAGWFRDLMQTIGEVAEGAGWIAVIASWFTGSNAAAKKDVGTSANQSQVMEAAGADIQIEQVYLALEAMFADMDPKEMQKPLGDRERDAFNLFIDELTPAEANIVMGGLSKKESDITITEPVKITVTKKGKPGQAPRKEDQIKDKQYRIQTNDRGRRVMKGVGRYILAASTDDEKKERIQTLVRRIRHTRLAANFEDSLSAKEKKVRETAKEKTQQGETLIHLAFAWYFTDWQTLRQIMQRDSELVDLRRQMREEKDLEKRMELRETYQKRIHQVALIIRSNRKANRAAAKQWSVSDKVVFIGVPVLVAFLITLLIIAK